MQDELLQQAQAVELLRGLVAIPSLSRQEQDATAWLAAQMESLGLVRCGVDAAGNAVGELGPADAPRVVMLLGHIDTVPGSIPVRFEDSDAGPLLYGRGTVDAKGPLATFVAAAARVGHAWAQAQGVRVVVVGAVEEEAATSKGARSIRSRFDGTAAPVPAACIIGEPSGWTRVTLGYKGRLLVEIVAGQPMAHTAGPDAGVATIAVDLWNWINGYAAAYNADRPRAFDQLQPSLRRVHTDTTAHMEDTVEAQIGIRLPLDFNAHAFVAEIVDWLNARVGGSAVAPAEVRDAEVVDIPIVGPQVRVDLRLRGYEPTWRSERDPLLVRSFLNAIRTVAPAEKPGFVVKTGTSDMNVVAPVWGCPIVAYGPGDSTLDHTPHEHIAVDEYWRAVLVLEQTLRNLLASLAGE